MDFAGLIPEIIVCLTALMVIITDWFIKEKSLKNITGFVGICGLVVALAVLIGYKASNFSNAYDFGGMFLSDELSWYFRVLLLLSGIICFLLSFRYVKDVIKYSGEFYALIVFATLGGMLLSASGEMVALYLALELLSISSYVLSGFRKDKQKSSEAALKYLIIGSISSAIMLYGMSILFGVTASTEFKGIAAGLIKNQVELDFLTIMGMILVISGLSYKISAVPFHMWAPDVYEGAPTPVTAFLSVSSKIAGFAALLRILECFSVNLTSKWVLLIIVLSVLTMTYGNIVAIAQKNIKRMLAYSGIAHAGYLLIGIIAMSSPLRSSMSIGAILYYLLAYLFMNLGAFTIIVYFASQIGSTRISDFSGLAKKSPYMAFILACCLVSLAGLPPFAGFTGKIYLFGAAINAGYTWLAVIGVINSLISLYYYIRIIRVMYFGQTEEIKTFTKPSPALVLAAIISFIGLIVMFIFPSFFINLISMASVGI